MRRAPVFWEFAPAPLVFKTCRWRSGAICYALATHLATRIPCWCKQCSRVGQEQCRASFAQFTLRAVSRFLRVSLQHEPVPTLQVIHSIVYTYTHTPLLKVEARPFSCIASNFKAAGSCSTETGIEKSNSVEENIYAQQRQNLLAANEPALSHYIFASCNLWGV